ncbi:uncharacterized protein V1510DRAFT_414606 [Dipodascopsis tothii]|uniref:uncharacterized protein n=1 Tax=Dipodascopsis tothii TaxID=44089 RepID=UPI0034CE6B4A
MIKAQEFVMSFWHSADPEAEISPSHALTYADRVRIRQPGDAGFALGPHVDGGSVERWEDNGYGLGKVYDKIWQGKWEEYDPWETSCRLPMVTDLYNGPGACSMFRMFQGWLSMSTTGPFQGTLLVNPLLSISTAYYLLRPFFSPINPIKDTALSETDESFLDPSNWNFDKEITSDLQGANPGFSQELNSVLHPHMKLSKSMVHIPDIKAGDYVVWHCDTIHAVDKVHSGHSDSSVLYIPACPLTEANARYLKRQRDDFLVGTPAPDFPGGIGEANHVGRLSVEDVADQVEADGLRAFGLKGWEMDSTLTPGQKAVLAKANDIMGF